MKADRRQVEQALKSPGSVRFFLLHGPDEAGSRSLIALLARAMGADAERVDLAGSELKADPARLADEAASLSLFGGARYIVVEPAGDDCLAAVEALVEVPAAANPVVLVAGALKPASKLLKLALAARDAMALASYVPEGREAERLALDLAREQGLVAPADVARRIAEACGGNRALIAQEIAKFALFLDASPDTPRPLDDEVVGALGAGNGEGDLSRLVDCVASGDSTALDGELLRLKSEGVEGVPLVRALLRRMILIARLRAEVEAGSSVSAVMASSAKSLFWKEKPAVERQLSRWRPASAAKSVGRLVEAERAIKASGSLGAAAVEEELFAICRQAARAR